MVETYPSTEPTLTYQRKNIAIHGSRVVVEATYPLAVKNSPEKSFLKRKYWDMPAAVECTFEGEKMRTFAWLVPNKMALRYPLKPAKEIADE